MYLKGLELENFKSFKGQVDVPFIRGFTAITGPNGSGKSNCGDAIQFVLGTKSNKNIRADNSKDLIFNGGGSNRPARGCKVTLIFDNPAAEDERRSLNIDTDEVRLTRSIRLTKSNNVVSEYFLNGESSSRNHFRMLLAGANASADGYNIVLQGDVTNLARMTPSKRRKVLDKVAGVTDYDDEIRKAHKQKERVDEFIERITLLETELSSQLKDLKREREQAISAQSLIDELSAAKATLLHAKHRSRYDEIQFLSEEQVRYNEEGTSLKAKVQIGAKELLQLDEKVADLEKQIADVLGEEASQLRERINKLHRETDRRRDQITDSETAIADAEEDIEILLGEEKEAQSALDEHTKEVLAAQSALKEAEANFISAETAEAEAKDALSTGDKHTRELTRALGKAGEVAHEVQGKLSDAQLKRDRAAQHVELTAQQLAEAQEQVTEAQLAVDDLKLEGEELGEDTPVVSRKKLGESLVQMQRSETKLSTEFEAINSRLREADRNLALKRAELEGASGGRGGHIAAVQRLLHLRDSGQRRGIIGTISELCKPRDSSHELALATAIGMGGMSAIVVESDQVAAECMAWLRENRVGRAMFLPLNQMKSYRVGGKARMIERQPGVLGLASELLEFDPRFENAVHYVVRDTLVVSDLATARKHMGGVRLVTIRGDITEHGGAMQGGAPMKIKTGFGGKLAGASEIEKLEAEVNRLQLMADTVNASLGEARAKQQKLRQQINEITNDDSALKLRQWREELRLAEGRLSKAIGIVKKVEAQLAQSDKALKAKEDSLAVATTALEQAEADRTTANEALQSASPQHLQDMLRKSQELRVNAESQKAKAEAILSSGSTHGSIFSDRVKELAGRRNRLAKDNANRSSRNGKLEIEITNLSAELSIAEDAHSKITSEHSDLDQKRIQATEERIGLRLSLEQEAAQAETLLNRANDLTLQIQLKQTELAELTNEMATMDLAPASAGVSLPPVGEAETNVRKLERRLELIGPVNMLAIEKYDSTVDRVESLKGDNKKLNARRRELDGLAERLEKQRKKRLSAVLKEVDSNFREVYKNLSGGGKGELFLEKPDDPFKGGLSMWAKPPGKSSKVKLEQLSGGEQSMASLALIFAIQDYDPSPFYYFDEVDQNLDPINAERIATMCRLRSEKAQFIQVTLRKVSLQLADHHIGITHAGDGCSRRIANFDRERAIELGEKAFSELKDNIAANERQDLLERLGDLPDPNDMELIPEEIEYPESLGGLEDEGEAETSVGETTDTPGLTDATDAPEITDISDTTNPLGDLQARTADLSEDIDEEQNLHKAISQADEEAPDDPAIEEKTIDEDE